MWEGGVRLPGGGCVSGMSKEIRQVRTGEWRKESDLRDLPIHPEHPHRPGFPCPARRPSPLKVQLFLHASPHPVFPDATGPQHRPPKCSGSGADREAAGPSPSLSRRLSLQGPAVRVMLGLRSLRIIGPSGQRHGGFAGESSRHLQGSSRGLGDLALHSHLPGTRALTAVPWPLLQEEFQEGLDDILEQEEYEDPGVPVPQVEEPEGKPSSLSAAG